MEKGMREKMCTGGNMIKKLGNLICAERISSGKKRVRKTTREHKSRALSEGRGTQSPGGGTSSHGKSMVGEVRVCRGRGGTLWKEGRTGKPPLRSMADHKA